ADAGGVAAAISGGKVRALAVTSAKRASGFPEVPTVVELGYPNLQMSSWMGILAPAGTPAPIVGKLQAEIARIVATPQFRERMAALHVDHEASTPKKFADMITSGLEQWQAVAKAANIQPN